NLPENVRLTRSFAPGVPAVEADAAQLAQLITSLVVNAVEALGSGGGSVRVATGVEEEDPGGRAAGDWVLHPGAAASHVYLEVSDAGCGLPREWLPRIFAPSFTPKGRGRGRGLCAVVGAARAHGGGIRAASAPGAGTPIRILSPPPEPPADEPQRPTV